LVFEPTMCICVVNYIVFNQVTLWYVKQRFDNYVNRVARPAYLLYDSVPNCQTYTEISWLCYCCFVSFSFANIVKAYNV